MGLNITQNSLQNLARFLVRLWVTFGAQNGATNAPKSFPRASQDALGVGSCFRSRFRPISGRFLTPGALETPATEPFRLNGGRERKRFEVMKALA